MAVRSVLSNAAVRLVPRTKQATMIITVSTITEQVAGIRMVRLWMELKPPPLPPPPLALPEEVACGLYDRGSVSSVRVAKEYVSSVVPVSVTEAMFSRYQVAGFRSTISTNLCDG
ncbi:hypothetical protein TYRP_019169 [Tyrophagus putrescentiae]|nr:hypothetical protein TYRP_019169 [Tyrophagus putrescentiae]